MPRGSMRPIKLGFALLFAGGICFVWGFFAHRDHWFPHGILQGLAQEFADRDAPRDPFPKQLVESRSPAFDDLAALGYVDASFDPDSDQRGVVLAERDRFFPGFNLYSSRTARSAQLIDMQGGIVHSWASDTTDTWQSVSLLEDGRLFVLEKDRALLALDRDSRPLWRFEARVHHDLDVFDEEIRVLSRREEMRPEFHPTRPIVVDMLSILSLDGTLREEISLLDIFQRSTHAYLLPSLIPAHDAGDRKALDLLHTNHVEVLDGTLAHRSEVFARGNLLLSARNLNAIFILDAAAERILWLWGPGNLTFPHHPQLLANGNLLLFDNGLEASRILELEPLERCIAWSYEAEGFFSVTRGSVQRLPNGNTLITESDAGYAFEVDPQGETVWEFANPDVDAFGHRSAMWRVTRYAPEELLFVDADTSTAR